MADEQDKQQPSLELPGVFGRKKKGKQTGGRGRTAADGRTGRAD